MRTLVARGDRTISGQLFRHGTEIPPGLLLQGEIDLGVDHRWLLEYEPSERRSLYRIFAPFSGCGEKQPLTNDELTMFALRP